MKQISLVIGEGGTGKSSLIRCLTGVSKESRRKVLLINAGIVDMYIWVRSIQEGRCYSPHALLNAIVAPSEANFHHYLVALRLNPFNSCPGAQDYINVLQTQCTISNVVVLSENGNPPTLALPNGQLNISFSQNYPANEIANQVRNTWGWL